MANQIPILVLHLFVAGIILGVLMFGTIFLVTKINDKFFKHHDF